MNRKEGSGRPRSVTTEENTDLIEELICSQKEVLHSHLTPCKIAKKNWNQSFENQKNDKKKTLLSVQKGKNP